MATFWQDLRYAAKLLLKRPGVTLIAVGSLALGVGANTAVFSLVNAVMLRPLPIAEPGRVFDVDPASARSAFANFSYPIYRDFRDNNDVLEGMAAYRFAPMSLSRDGNNERVWGFLVSGNYFDVLGVKAARGQFFDQEDDRVPGASPVVILSYGCWERRFGGDPKLIGKTITINSQSFTVMGVAPEEFRGTVIIFTPDFYVPMMMARQIEPGSNWLDEPGNGVLFAFGRLKQGVSRAQAQESLNLLGTQLARDNKNLEGVTFTLTPPGLVVPMLRNQTLSFAWVLLSTVGLVLLIACVNLANLLLARAAERRREISIRLALGARRSRLVRQLLTESLLLALIGGAAGWLVTIWILDLANSFKPPLDFPLTISLTADWRMLLFTLLASVITAALFGLVPALRATKMDLVSTLKDETAAAGSKRSRLRSGLVVAQVAFSLVALVAAGLIVRSLQQVQTVGPGFEIDRTLTMSVDLGLQGYDEARGREFYKRLIDRVKTLPSVSSVSFISYLPLALDRNSKSIYTEGRPVSRIADLPEIQYASVWPRYFETLGISVLDGREFTIQDDKKESRFVIVNETFAKRFWPGQSAVGQRVSTGGQEGPFWQVIAVVANAKYWSLGEDPQPFIYFPMLRDYERSAALVVRTTTEPAGLIGAVRREVQALDPNLPVIGAKTFREHMGLSLFPLRTGAWMAGGFALVALMLTALGLYGVTAYSVSQRTREIGLRMALGAQAGDVLKLVISRSAVLAFVGLAIGLSVALAITRLMTSVLYGVSATDPSTFLAVPLVLVAASLIASWIPARRATKVDPMEALRYE